MSFPSAITGLAFRLDGSALAWEDTGAAVLAVEPAGRVRRIDQPSPLSGAWLSASDANRPFRDANALDFQLGATPQYLPAPAGTTLPGNDCTIAASWVMRDTNTLSGYGLLADTEQELFTGTDGAGKFGLVTYSDRLAFYYRDTFWDPFASGIIATKPGIPCSVVVTFASTGVRLKYSIGGAVGTFTLSTSIAASTATGLQIGTSATTGRLHAAVSQVAGYSRAVNDTERDTLLDWLVANQPVPYPTTAPLVVIVGDSIARGVPLPTRQGAWPFLMLPNLYSTAPVRLNDTAISGWTLEEMQGQFSVRVEPLRSLLRLENILILAGGTNSLYFGDSAATVLSLYLTYLDIARASGYKVIAHTILPRSGGVPTTFEADRLTVNAGIRAAASHYDALADTAAVVGMGAFGDQLNATNYYDQTHPTPAGHVLLEPAYRAAVLQLLASEPTPPGPPPFVSTKALTIERVLDWSAEPAVYLFSLANSGASAVVTPSEPDMAITLSDGSFVTLTDGSYATTA